MLLLSSCAGANSVSKSDVQTLSVQVDSFKTYIEVTLDYMDQARASGYNNERRVLDDVLNKGQPEILASQEKAYTMVAFESGKHAARVGGLLAGRDAISASAGNFQSCLKNWSKHSYSMADVDESRIRANIALLERIFSLSSFESGDTRHWANYRTS